MLDQLWGKVKVMPAPPPAAGATKGSASVKDGSWTKPAKAELKKSLTPLQYEVTQESGTERAFHGCWNNHEPGIYVDVVSGEPLFSSLDKFDSGTGWPSFTRPLVAANVASKTDVTLRHAAHRGALDARRLAPRARLRRRAGPDRLRFCINSASLRFVPLAKLEAEGYGEYKVLFEQKVAASK